MKILKGPLPILVICFYFLLRIANSSTPVSDDFCYAYGSKLHGVYGSFWYLVTNWTPSIFHLYELGIWNLPLSPQGITRFIGYFTLVLSSGFLIIAALRILRAAGIKDLVNSISVLLVGFIGSIAIIQYSIFTKSISNPEINPVEILKTWVVSFFTQFRDGELLRWMYSTTLTSTRVVLTSAIILFVVQQSLVTLKVKSLNFFRYQFLPVLLALAWGLSTESLILLTYLAVSNTLLIFRKKAVFKSSLLLFTILFGSLSLYAAPGSRFRNSLIPDRPLSKYILLFGANFWNMCWILLSTLCIAFLTSRLIIHFSKHSQITFPNSLQKNIRILGISTVGAQLVISTGAYPAAYHLAPFIWITFLWWNVEFISLNIPKQNKFGSFTVYSILFYCFSSMLIITLAITSQTADARSASLNERAKDSRRSGIHNTQVIPLVDNLGNYFSTDLQPSAQTIVPFKGYIRGATVYCYKQLPLGF